MAEKQLIDHLLKDIQELKVLNNKYQQELETCNHFRIKHLEEKFIEEKEKRVELSQKYEEEQQYLSTKKTMRICTINSKRK